MRTDAENARITRMVKAITSAIDSDENDDASVRDALDALVDTLAMLCVTESVSVPSVVAVLGQRAQAMKAALPAAVARLLTGAGLDPGGGRVVQPGPMPYSPTEVDTLTTRDVTEPLEDTDELKTTEER